MIHTDTRFSETIEAVIGEIEASTDAEIVLVASPCSGRYDDLAWILAGVVSTGVLAFLCWSPIPFDATWFPLDVGFVTLATGLVLAWRRALTVTLAGERRRRRQVREAALAAFAEENVHGTEARVGLLVYVSALEQRVELIPDQGLLAKIPGGEWNQLDLRARSLDELVGGLRRVGELLAERFPASGSNPDLIANTPRVRS